MESIYQDLIKDADLQERNLKDSCLQKEDYERLKNVSDLEARSGKVEAMIKNESEYDAILYVAEPNSKGKVFSMIIMPGETKVFNLDAYNTLLLVAGDEFQKYKAPAGALADEYPSNQYTHHFCETDLNYKESINTAYKLKHIKKGKTKMLLVGDKGGYFHLIDVHGVLEPI